MSSDTLTWHDFLNEAKSFIQISESLGDNWYIHKENDNEGNSFLVYKQKIAYLDDRPIETSSLLDDDDVYVEEDQSRAENTAKDLLQMEYHIVYSISYQVPVMYMQAHRSDGSQLQLEAAWRIFCNYTDDADESVRSNLLSMLTQMEHPVLFKPFLALHPCRTAELLGQAGTSRNRILTFISLMGPYMKLNLSNEYGLALNADT